MIEEKDKLALVLSLINAGITDADQIISITKRIGAELFTQKP